MNNITPPLSPNAPIALSKIAWTTTPATYDVAANGPGGSASPANGRCCRWASCTTAGTLNYTTWDNVAGAIAMVAGFLYHCPAAALVNTSTAQGVTIYW
jgi:hypothetical protein